MYESGGNADLRSSAGANGYFQVMPATFRLLGVPSNIEAGIKYLGQLTRQFGREDYALAAYNGGPARVARGRSMPLESLQYVIGVGNYRSVLKAHAAAARLYAGRLALEQVRPTDTWWTLSERLKVPVTQLRLENPFLAARALRGGSVIAYSPAPRGDLLAADGATRYRTRLGDDYLKIAFALDVDLDLLRRTNDLWRLQPPLPGLELSIPLDPTVTFRSYTVRAGDDLAGIASRWNLDPWEVVRDNYLWDERPDEGMVLRIRQPQPRPQRSPRYLLHRVRRGETLSGIARRYGTSVGAIRSANGLGLRSLLLAGQRLKIPGR